MTDIIPHVQINVTRNCLLEFLDILYENKCHDICVTYSDYSWHVQYDSPFVHDPEVKKDANVEMYAMQNTKEDNNGCR